MTTYLLDTNICIYFLKGQYNIDKKIAAVSSGNCFVSEITIAELKYGVENSKDIPSMKAIIEKFIPLFSIIPIYDSLDIFASEKAWLRKNGILIDDFDILIGATALKNNMVMVTNNVNHLGRLNNIIIEDWVHR